MQTPFNLHRLRELRKHGQSPSLPVFIAPMGDWVFTTNMEAMGALAIRVKPADFQQNWDALAGLEVILNLPHERLWSPLMRAVRDSHPRRLQALVDNCLTTFWWAE
jgi:hypothetical protein